MNDERVIPTEGVATVVTYALLVDGTELPLTYGVYSIITTKEVNRIPTAKIVFRDGDAAAEDFEISNTADLIPGKKIEIKAGYASKEKTIFKGIIVKHGIKIREQGSSVLFVECKDESVKMTVGRKNNYFLDKKDSDVIKKLITDTGLQADVEATTLQHKELVQYYATDWDFLLSRADVNGLLVLVDDGKVSVKPPTFSGKADLSVIHGDTIYEFEAEMDARHQYKAATSYSWDYAKQKLLNKKGKAPAANGQGNLKESELAKVIGLSELTLQHTGQVVDQELQAWADAQLVKSHLAKIVGRVKIEGFSEIKPGQLIELNGVGDRFNGTAYVAGVRQELVDGTWYTHVQFGLPPEWFSQRQHIVAPSASGLLPAMHGLQIGVVTKLEADPDGEDRIQVRLPILDAQAKGIWCRVASLDAGDNRGFFFRPEIDDEVVVGFLNGDPRDPVVLGMLHSSKKPAPIQATDDNHKKGLVTRSEMKILFDDEKSIITIETPGGHSVVIDDDAQAITLTDSHGNSITMDSDGITLDASKITLKAQQEIILDAGSNLTAEAAANVNIKAGAQLKAEGSAGAELSTSAIATIKGSLVKIN